MRKLEKGHRAEDRRPKAEVRGQRSEDRRQKAEIRGPITDLVE
jgi:hypothetical protein